MMANETTALSRRAFLSATGALVVALVARAEFAQAAAKILPSRPALTPDKLSSYIAIDPDGTVIAYYGKIDGGQGLETSIAQLVAEEIDVPWERVRVVMGDSALTINMGGATAGNGLRQGGLIMRRTAAEARRLLIEMAAEVLNKPAAELTVTDGVVHALSDPQTNPATDPAKRISYAELVGGRHLDAPIAWTGKAQQLSVKVQAPLKKPSEFKVIGKPMPRRDMAGKVFGTLQQCSDVRLPGMLHARMIRPTVAGAVPVAVDESSVRGIAGAKVVWIKDFLAVVAEKEWNAVKASQALKVTWSQSKPNFPGHDKLFDHIRAAPVVKRSSDPDRRVRSPARRRVGGRRLQAGGAHHRRRIRISDPVAWQHGARLRGRRRARRRRHGVDQHPETARLRQRHRRDPGAAARESAGDLDVRYRRLRPRRPGRRHRRGRGAVAAYSAGRCPECSTCAMKRWPGTPRAPPPSFTAAASGLDATGTGDRLREHQQVVPRWRTATLARRSIRATRSSAWRSGTPLNWRPSFGTPGNNYAFDNGAALGLGVDRAARWTAGSAAAETPTIRDPFGPLP